MTIRRASRGIDLAPSRGSPMMMAVTYYCPTCGRKAALRRGLRCMECLEGYD